MVIEQKHATYKSMNTNICISLSLGMFQFYHRAYINILRTYFYAFVNTLYRKSRERNTLVPDGDVNVYPWSCSFKLTRGARRKPIMGNTGPSFGCTVKQIFNEIFFFALWWLQPMHEQEGKERKRARGGGAEEGRTNARASTYVYIKKRGKKKREFVTLIGLAGRWTRDLSVGRGVRISKIREPGNTRGRDRGACREWKKRNEPCGAWKGSCERNFFFPYKKGPRAVQR